MATTATSPPLFSLHRHHRRKPSAPAAALPSSFPLSVSSSLFSVRRNRRNSRRRPREPTKEQSKLSDRDLELSLDAEAIAARASTAATRLRRSSEERLRHFLDSGREALDDLCTCVRVVDRGPNRVMVFACRQSSLVFLWNLVLWSFAVVLAARAAIWLGLGFRSRWGFGDGGTVVRRDRSLGGREVVVGRRVNGRREAERMNYKVLTNPLSPARGLQAKSGNYAVKRRSERKEKLPSWWPESLPSPVIVAGKQEYQREADKLVRAIVDYKMSGKDYNYIDFIQLRHICKVSGAKVSFETENSRDSFYRAAVDFVMNSCSSVLQLADILKIDGEEARQFIAGLADNIGLDQFRAATLVRAAVAARTRSHLLQCWALEVQNKRPEALEELLRICLIHRVFPPEEQSAEMEMVANGLARNLNVEQRKHLFDLYIGICGSDSQKTMMEALGLE